MKQKRYTVRNSRSRSRRGGWETKKPGFRASRLAEARRKRRRRNSMFIIIGGVALSVLLFVGIFLLLRSDDDAGDRFEVSDSGDVSSVIIMVNDDTGALGQVLLLTVEGESVRAVSFPARTVANVPGHGFLRLDQVEAAGGQELLDQTIANLVQFPVQYHIATDFATLQLAAEQLGTVDLQMGAAANLNVDGVPVALVAGVNPVPSDQVAAWLSAAAADGEAGPEVQAGLIQGLRDGFVARTGTDREAFAEQLYDRLDTDLGRDQFVELFLAATAAPEAFIVIPLPVRLVDNAGDWYLEPVLGEIERIFGTVEQADYTLEVRNGTETPGAVEWAAERLTPLGFPMVQLPETSGVNFEFTQIRYGSDASREANSVRELLGAGTLIKDDNLENNAIIVIIGLDLAGAVQGG